MIGSKTDRSASHKQASRNASRCDSRCSLYQYKPRGGTSPLEGSDILVATGRIPNTQHIGLDKTGVALDARGYVQVNERLETTAPGVWALGELRGQPSVHTHL